MVTVSSVLFWPRYNNYDRAVINTVPYDVVHRWYAAHRTLTTELRRPENELWVKLKPGKVVTGCGSMWSHFTEGGSTYLDITGTWQLRQLIFPPTWCNTLDKFPVPVSLSQPCGRMNCMGSTQVSIAYILTTRKVGQREDMATSQSKNSGNSPKNSVGGGLPQMGK